MRRPFSLWPATSGSSAAGGIALAILLSGSIVACSSAVPSQTPSESSPVAVIDNCGTAVPVPAEAPERIVTIKSTSTEMLLALGLGDQIVGSAFPDGPLPSEWAESATIPVISDFAPSQEAVLSLAPDFVFAGWESMFAADAAGTRPTLETLGVGTYVAPSACQEPGYQPEKLSFDDVFDEIEEAGQLFGAEAAAAELVDEQRIQLEGIPTDDRGLSAIWYSSGTDTPYVGAGIGAPQMMMEKLGLVNVASDIPDTWTSLGWEAVIEDDPDVIVLVDASWNTADSKIAQLEANPATAALSAVANSRYLVIPFPAGEAGVRNVPATADLAAQLAELSIG